MLHASCFYFYKGDLRQGTHVCITNPFKPTDKRYLIETSKETLTPPSRGKNFDAFLLISSRVRPCHSKGMKVVQDFSFFILSPYLSKTFAVSSLNHSIHFQIETN